MAQNFTVPVTVTTDSYEALKFSRTGAGYSYLSTYRSGVRQGVVGDVSSGFGLWTDPTVPMVFVTNGGYVRMSIDDNGNVGINNALRAGTDFSTMPAPSYGGIMVGQFGGGAIGELQFLASAASSGYGFRFRGDASNGGFRIDRRANSATWADFLMYTPDGKVGIGTMAPGYTLDVTGTIHATQIIGATYQDIAEWVPAAQPLAPGTVVVLDGKLANHVTASGKPYDTKVAGVVSPNPGMVLGEKSEGKAQIATTGRVRVKVDASRPIEIGDLLVTSDKPGMAMKSQPVSIAGVEMHRPGTVIGKALEPLASGEGEILVLLSLQ